MYASSQSAASSIYVADGFPQLWLITSAVTDVLIAVVMTFLVCEKRSLRAPQMSSGRISQLRHTKSPDGRQPNHVMARIVRLTIESNALTGKCTLVTRLLRHFILRLLKLAWPLFRSYFMWLSQYVKIVSLYVRLVSSSLQKEIYYTCPYALSISLSRAHSY